MEKYGQKMDDESMKDSSRRMSQAFANIDYYNQQQLDALNKYVLSQEKNLSDWEGRQVALAGELKINEVYDQMFARIEARVIDDLEDESFVEELVKMIVERDNYKEEDPRINKKAKKEVDGFDKIIEDMTDTFKTISDFMETTEPITTEEGKEATAKDLKKVRAYELDLKEKLKKISKEHDEAREILQKIQQYYLGHAEFRVYQQVIMQRLTDKMQARRHEDGGNTPELKELHEDAFRWSREAYDGARETLDDLEAFEEESERRLEMSQNSRRQR